MDVRLSRMDYVNQRKRLRAKSDDYPSLEIAS